MVGPVDVEHCLLYPVLHEIIDLIRPKKSRFSNPEASQNLASEEHNALAGYPSSVAFANCHVSANERKLCVQGSYSPGAFQSWRIETSRSNLVPAPRSPGMVGIMVAAPVLLTPL